MLSILQRQAKHLEKELNDTRQNLLERSRELDGEKSRVTERDERIETLEIEIDALRNRPRASPKKRAASERLAVGPSLTRLFKALTQTSFVANLLAPFAFIARRGGALPAAEDVSAAAPASEPANKSASYRTRRKQSRR